MLTRVLQTLTREQRAALYKVGITRQRLYEFRKGIRLPTEAQVAHISEITQCPWAELQAEVTRMHLAAEAHAQPTSKTPPDPH